MTLEDAYQAALFDSRLTALGTATPMRGWNGSALGDRPIGRSDLLPGKTVSAIVTSIAERHVRSCRRQEQRQRLSVLVEHSARGRQIGFLRAGKGGSRALAARLQVPTASLKRDLRAMEADGKAQLWHTRAGGRHDALVGVQLPLVTEFMVWLGANLFAALTVPAGAPTTNQVRKVLHLAMTLGWSALPTLESRSQASALIETMSSEVQSGLPTGRAA
jgi:hypothetical protein